MLSLTLSSLVISVLAQDNEAVILIHPSAGGNTSPAPGTYTYPQDTIITLEATPNEGFEFLYWVVVGELIPGAGQGTPNEVITDDGEPISVPTIPQTDFLIFTENPAQITCGFGYTYQYQAVFTPIAAGIEPPESIVFFDPFDSFEDPPTREETTIIGVSSTLGGTTDPSSGRYLFGDIIEPNLTLTATPNDGFEFQHWIVTGDYMPGHGGDPSLDTNVIPNNPLEANHGKGYSYNYEAVFTLIDSDGDENGQQDGVSHPFGLSAELLTALIVILAIAVIAAVLFGLYMYTKRK